MSLHTCCACFPCLVTKSCPTLWDRTDYSPPAPPSMGFPRQEYWSGVPFPSPGDLPDPGIEPMSPAWQAAYHWATREASPLCPLSRQQQKQRQFRKVGNDKCWEDCGNIETLTHCWWERRQGRHSGVIWQYLVIRGSHASPLSQPLQRSWSEPWEGSPGPRPSIQGKEKVGPELFSWPETAFHPGASCVGQSCFPKGHPHRLPGPHHPVISSRCWRETPWSTNAQEGITNHFRDSEATRWIGKPLVCRSTDLCSLASPWSQANWALRASAFQYWWDKILDDIYSGVWLHTNSADHIFDTLVLNVWGHRLLFLAAVWNSSKQFFLC